jgi:hypothetical protein
MSSVEDGKKVTEEGDKKKHDALIQRKLLLYSI